MLVVFDFDGTIADTFAQSLELLREVWPDFWEKEVEMYREKGAMATVKTLGMSPLKIIKMVRVMARKQTKSINEAKPFEGIKEVIDRLRERGIEVGVLSSNSQENLEKWFKNWEIKVDWIRSEKTLFNKERAILKIKKEGMIYVGDEVRDVEACQKAEVKIIAVSWGFNSKNALKKAGADYVVDTVQELRNLFLSFSQ